MPIEAHVSPLPSELTTPPVTKMCFVMSPSRSGRFDSVGKCSRFHVLVLSAQPGAMHSIACLFWAPMRRAEIDRVFVVFVLSPNGGDAIDREFVLRPDGAECKSLGQRPRKGTRRLVHTFAPAEA
jgi:hypothetical protein